MGRGKHQHNLELIERAKEILAEIQPCSVRAVCYPLFIVHGLIPSMAKTCTNRVSHQLVYAREQGIIPWEWIVEEGGGPEGDPGFRDPDEYMRWASREFRRNHWVTQKCNVQIWSEKGTVRGTVKPVMDEFGVLFNPFGGHGSATRIHDAIEWNDFSRRLVILYVGDWDPSGMHMSEIDIPRRLYKYATGPAGLMPLGHALAPSDPLEIKRVLLEEANIEVRRLALSAEDVADPALPSFPAIDKRLDTRLKWFLRTYGPECWELDALSPNILRERLAEAVREEIDWGAWNRCALAEAAEKETLTAYFKGWKKAISRQAQEKGPSRPAPKKKPQKRTPKRKPRQD